MQCFLSLHWKQTTLLIYLEVAKVVDDGIFSEDSDEQQATDGVIFKKTNPYRVQDEASQEGKCGPVRWAQK